MEGRKLASTIISVSCKTLLFVLVVLLLVFVGRKAFHFGHDVFTEHSMDSESDAVVVTVSIPENVALKDVAELFHDNGLIDDVAVFEAQVRLSDYYGKFLPGTYELNTAMTPTEMISIISTPVETESEE